MRLFWGALNMNMNQWMNEQTNKGYDRWRKKGRQNLKNTFTTLSKKAWNVHKRISEWKQELYSEVEILGFLVRMWSNNNWIITLSNYCTLHKIVMLLWIRKEIQIDFDSDVQTYFFSQCEWKNLITGNIFVPQFNPVYHSTQLHVYWFIWTIQVALFKQGLLAHSFIIFGNKTGKSFWLLDSIL